MSNEIKGMNKKKQGKKYAVRLFFCALVGAVIGLGLQRLSTHVTLTEFLAQMQGAILSVLPFVIPALLLCINLPVGMKLKKVKAAVDKWDGEDETVADLAEIAISKFVLAINVSFYLSMLVLSLLMTYAFQEELPNMIVSYILVLVFFIVSIFVTIKQQKGYVDLEIQLNPEKKVSIYDMKFQKKWDASLDEAEKIAVGACAYASFKTVNTVCVIIWLLLILLSILTPVGALPFVIVITILIAANVSFILKDLKSRKTGIVMK